MDLQKSSLGLYQLIYLNIEDFLKCVKSLGGGLYFRKRRKGRRRRKPDRMLRPGDVGVQECVRSWILQES